MPTHDNTHRKRDETDGSTKTSLVLAICGIALLIGVAGCATGNGGVADNPRNVTANSIASPLAPTTKGNLANGYSLLVSIRDQRLALLQDDKQIRTFVISTAVRGVGELIGSDATPRGIHSIADKVGAGEPVGMVFDSLKPTGEIVQVNAPNRSPIITRVLPLQGLEATNRTTLERNIYIHGSPVENLLGVPASGGCIRVSSADILELYDLVSIDTKVYIFETSIPDAISELAKTKTNNLQTTKLAEGGDQQLIHRLCFSHSYGTNGLQIDYALAQLWCGRGVREGIPSSMILLAESFEFGRGTPKDLTRARVLYERAADLGHAQAQAKAGVFLWMGTGGKRDAVRALELLSKAAAQGHQGAQKTKEEIEKVSSSASVRGKP